jgi:hypothetical protein
VGGKESRQESLFGAIVGGTEKEKKRAEARCPDGWGPEEEWRRAESYFAAGGKQTSREGCKAGARLACSLDRTVGDRRVQGLIAASAARVVLAVEGGREKTRKERRKSFWEDRRGNETEEEASLKKWDRQLFTYISTITNQAGLFISALSVLLKKESDPARPPRPHIRASQRRPQSPTSGTCVLPWPDPTRPPNDLNEREKNPCPQRGQPLCTRRGQRNVEPGAPHPAMDQRAVRCPRRAPGALPCFFSLSFSRCTFAWHVSQPAARWACLGCGRTTHPLTCHAMTSSHC